jgi:hypothetical protein
MNGTILTFKVKPDFKQFIEKQAKKKGLKTGAYIKAVLKKHTGFKERELV